MKTGLVDNPKAVVLKNNNGKVVFNTGFLLLADYYDFLPRGYRSRRARIRGKVEQMMKYISQRAFLSDTTGSTASLMSINNWNNA